MVALRESECLLCLKEKSKVRLDFADVTFVDGNGLRMLRRLAAKSVEIIDHSGLIIDSLKHREKN